MCREPHVFGEARIVTRCHFHGLVVAAPAGIGVQPGILHQLRSHRVLAAIPWVADGLRPIVVTLAVVDLAGGYDGGGIGRTAFQGVGARVRRDIQMRRIVCNIDNVIEKVNPGQFYSPAVVASVEGGVKGLFVVEKTRHRKKSREMANVLVVVM
jgi:hypothetical protein